MKIYDFKWIKGWRLMRIRGIGILVLILFFVSLSVYSQEMKSGTEGKKPTAGESGSVKSGPTEFESYEDYHVKAYGGVNYIYWMDYPTQLATSNFNNLFFYKACKMKFH